jgi:hypothetical protein
MAAFCPNCGQPLTGSASFCGNCGSSVAAAVAPAQAPTVQPAKGSGAGKIILIIFVVLAVVGVGVIGAVVYVGYRVKNRIENVARESGLAQPASAYGPAAKRTSDVCALLTPQELAAITGTPVARSQPGANSCSFFDSEGDASAPVVEYTVTWGQAKTQETAFKFAMKALTNGLPGKYVEPVSGVGDRAYFGPAGASLFVVKGDTWIEVDGRLMQSRDQLIQVAQKIVAKM